jgi:nicotinamidase-related amidase
MAFPPQAALVIIDMQQAFVAPGAALCISGAQATVPVIEKLAQAARDQQVPVIWVLRSYAPDGSNVEPARWKDLTARGYAQAGVLAPGSTGINSEELADGLHRQEGDLTVIKPRYSAFFHTDLETMLHDRAIKTLVVTGTTVPNCVRATVYDALSLDLETIIPQDAVSSNTPVIQETNLQDMARAGAIICRSEALIRKGKDENWMR